MDDGIRTRGLQGHKPGLVAEAESNLTEEELDLFVLLAAPDEL